MTLSIPVGFAVTEDEMGDYFVHVGIPGASMGGGLDQVYKVVVRPLRVNSENTKSLISGLPFYDGVKYRFRQHHNKWQLFKLEAGKRPVPLQLYKLEFSRASFQKYLLEFLNTNPKIYSEYDLGDKLKILGVMGLAQKGSELTVDFIESLNPRLSSENPEQPYPDLLINNIETMLTRFAYDMQFNGLPAPVVTAVEEIDENFLQFAMQRLPGKEQEIVDTYLNNKTNNTILKRSDRWIPHVFYKSEEATIEAKTWTEVPEDGDANEIMKISELPIKYIYSPYRMQGITRHGSPKALFLPVKFTVGTESFYPLFVFPAAFRHHKVMRAAITRELYHTQWWNAVAHLKHDDNSPEEKRVRELLLRTTLPHLEADIYKVTKLGGYTKKIADILEFAMEMRKAFLLPLNNATRNPDVALGQLRIPWTVHLSAIVPEGVHSVADISFTSALLKAVGGAHSFDPKRNLPIAVFAGGKRTDSLVDTITEKTDNYNPISGPVKRAKEAEADFIEAFSRGYLRSKESRNAKLEEAIDELKSQIIPVAQELLGPDNENRDYTLLDKIAWDGFAYSDLEWIIEATGLIDIEWKTTFKSKCKDLNDEGVLQSIENLYNSTLEEVKTTHVRLEDGNALLKNAVEFAVEKVNALLNNADLNKADAKLPEVVIGADLNELPSKLEGLLIFSDGNAKSIDLDDDWESKRSAFADHLSGVAKGNGDQIEQELKKLEKEWSSREKSIRAQIASLIDSFEEFIGEAKNVQKLLNNKIDSEQASGKDEKPDRDPEMRSIEKAFTALSLLIPQAEESLTEFKWDFAKIEPYFELVPWKDFKRKLWTRFFSQEDFYTFTDLTADLIKAWPTSGGGPEIQPEQLLPAE